MKKLVLTVTLNPAIDRTLKISNFRAGRDFYAEAPNLSAGGKGINVSRALRILGSNTLATGLLGGSNGDYIKRKLEIEAINNDFLRIEKETRVNFAVIDPAGGKTTRIIERGPLVSSVEIRRLRRKILILLKECAYVVFSGSKADGFPDSFYAELIEIANEKKVKTVVDTRGKPLLEAIKAKPFLIKPNLEEMEYIMKRKLRTLSGIRAAAQSILSRGVKIALITMSSSGAVAACGEEILFAVPPVLRRANIVGCGDAFIAGFIYSYSRGENFRDCVRMASAAGAANALAIQPCALRKKDVDSIVKRVKMRDLLIGKFIPLEMNF
ncbi:MAG: 1-phosphofructokinase family hexose kinase [Candidatus Omnitrophota bacterium]